MSVLTPSPGIGHLLRAWRQRRRMSQLDLSVEAEVSARHLSFVETGRSKPSRELVIHLAEHLDVPLRDRNDLLLAAGYAPVYAETPLEDRAMEPVRAALDELLAAHDPYPAVVVDRTWDLVTANRTALEVLTAGVDPALLEPPVNVLRVSLHPDGMAPRIANLAEWGSHLLTRLHRQALLTADPALEALRAEVADYPGIDPVPAAMTDPAAMLYVPLELRTGSDPGSGEGVLRFFSTIATFGTAVDITLAELSIESFYPADAHTAEVLRSHADGG